LDEQSKRYCQQCGKFHVLSDFDDGKRSCRRKLQRHNNRRRRKPSTSVINEQLAEDVLHGDDSQIEGKSSSSQAATEGGTLLDTEEQITILPSADVSNNQDSVQCESGSGVSLAAISAEPLIIDEDRDKSYNSPSYSDNKINPLLSDYPTGRISFKLYDWNPAEFPRRLRHQIFQWLASMPVELEGYIRPGCTILTMFIAMPNFMWIKLLEDPAVHIRNLVVAPGSMLRGRDTFLVYLNNIIYRVFKDGSSVTKVEMDRDLPKLHYVYPTCFEAGKPMEFVACGTNLLQPKLRFLVSFAGKYLRYDVCVPSSNEDNGSNTSFDHQLFKIYVPHTELNIYGPAFIEVENQNGLSNFIPILIASKEICSEFNKMQQKVDQSDYAASSSCELFVLRQKELSKFILDVAWLLRDPSLVNPEKDSLSRQIKRFNNLLSIFLENESTAVLEKALRYMNIVASDDLITGIADADMSIYKKNIYHARDLLDRKLPTKLDSRLLIANLEHEQNDSLTSQDLEESTSDDVFLLGADSLRSKEGQKKTKRSHNFVLYTKSIFASRQLILVIATATVCFGICAAVLHPVNVSKITTTVRRFMFDNS
jgi:hypothetical protein